MLKNPDCGFFRWVDLDYLDSAFFKQLLNDMRGAIWDLRKVVAQKDARLCANDTELKLMHKQLHDHMKLVEAKDMCMHDLEAKMKKKDRYIGMLVWMCVFLSVALIAIVFKVKLA